MNETDITRDHLNHVEQNIFDDAHGITVRAANQDEWGEIVVICGDDTRFSDDETMPLEQYAKQKLKSEDEYYFEKLMHKHPTWPQDTIALSYQSLEDNPFRDTQ